ncbi:MAG: PD-(D/E)XK nuclease family transposase, partial [Frisingicoccus sp.]
MEEKKALKDLNLINRFLFAEVMDDPEVNQDALSIILGQNIRLLSSPQTEKEHRVSPLAKSIRMDVFSVSEEGTVYDMEAQSTYQTDLQKRSRYYQSLMDSSLLEPGVDNYNQLNDSYIIVIADYDI